MNSRARIKRLAVYALLGIFLIVLINTSLNRHNHLVSGFLYSHAHPFGNAAQDIPFNGDSHNHSLIELFLLDFLTDQDFLELVFISIAFGFGSRFIFKSILTSTPEISRAYSRLLPRAPPV